MGCGSSSLEPADMDIGWTMDEMSDYILDMTDETIDWLFTEPSGEILTKRKKQELISLLEGSVFQYLIDKNCKQYSTQERSNIEQCLMPIKNNGQIKQDLQQICKWMLENKIGTHDRYIQKEEFPKFIGIAMSQYKNAMSGL